MDGADKMKENVRNRVLEGSGDMDDTIYKTYVRLVSWFTFYVFLLIILQGACRYLNIPKNDHD